MDRREFMKRSAVAAAWAAVGVRVPETPAVEVPELLTVAYRPTMLWKVTADGTDWWVFATTAEDAVDVLISEGHLDDIMTYEDGVDEFAATDELVREIAATAKIEGDESAEFEITWEGDPPDSDFEDAIDENEYPTIGYWRRVLADDLDPRTLRTTLSWEI